MAPIYVLPCQWFVEKELYNGGMVDGWKDKYYDIFLINNKEKVLKEYIYGLQWILDYYIGNAIDIDWYYPWMHTPLFEDVLTYLHHTTPEISYTISKYIEPEQQLAIVLPIQSYNLIENSLYKEFPKMYPQFYPDEFGFHSLGKKWFYECESNIPIFSTKFLRAVLKI
jgi:5'-3' exoribonuclease 1